MILNKAKISLIVCDIEGCISPGKGRPLDLTPLTQIKRHNQCAQKGEAIPLILCSGRPQPFIEAFAQMLDVTWPCICENGAFLYDLRTDRLIRHPDITKEHIQDLKELKSLLEFEVQPKIPHKIEPGKEICISLNPIAEPENYSAKIKKLFEQVSQYVNPELFFITHSASAVDITPKGIDKAAGLHFLSEQMDIPLEQMLGIGDTAGDLSFLRIVGCSAAPSNANEVVHKEVDYVSSQPHAYGVFEIISKINNNF